MLDRGRFTPAEVVPGLKDGRGTPAAHILVIAGHTPEEVAKYKPEDRDSMAALEIGISTAEVKLLNRLRAREVERYMPDVLQTAIEHPEAIFGQNYPLLRSFGRLIDGYNAGDWRQMLERRRGAVVATHDIDTIRHSFTWPSPAGWNQAAYEKVAWATEDAFSGAVKDAIGRAGTQYDDIARGTYPLTSAANAAALEIQTATYSGYQTRYLQSFQGRNLAPLTLDTLRIEATRGAYQ